MKDNSISGLALVLLVISSAINGYEVKLKHLSTLYLPSSFNGDVPQYEFDSDTVEKAAFEPTGKIVYGVGAFFAFCLF